MVYFFGFLGGLALFLYGMQLMGEGLQRAAGEQCHNGNDGWFCKRGADEFKAGLRRCNGCQYRHNHDGTAYCL